MTATPNPTGFVIEPKFLPLHSCISASGRLFQYVRAAATLAAAVCAAYESAKTEDIPSEAVAFFGFL